MGRIFRRTLPIDCKQKITRSWCINRQINNLHKQKAFGKYLIYVNFDEKYCVNNIKIL